MNDNKFWAILWSLVCGFLVTGVVALGLNYANSQNLVASMVKAGTDPIAASCAINGFAAGSASAIICLKATDPK